MPLKPVDQNIKVILGPCIDDTDFKTREELLTYNQAGMEIDVILEKHDGTIVTTAVTPTTAGDYDWAHTDQGYYEFELPASGGISFNNTEEGSLRVVGYCTGVLPFSSVTYDIVPEKVWNSLIEGSDNLEVDLTHIMGTILTEGGAGRLAAALIKLLDVATPVLTAENVNQSANNNTILAHADYGNAKLVRSTTPANALDVSATGEAGLDFNNVKDATGAKTLTNITVPTTTAVTNDVGITQAGADKVWSTAARTLTSFGTLVADIWNRATSLLTTVGSIGKLLVDNVNTTLSSRSSHGAADVWTAGNRELSTPNNYKADVSALALEATLGTANTHLTDIKGTGFVKDTHSQPQCLTATGFNTVVPDAAGIAAGLHTTTDGKVDAVQTDATAIKAKTDNLPSGIAKNVALPFFDFYMLLADGLTAATGKTVTGQIRKDNGAFAGITNIISEVGSGLYAIASGFTQAEMNADKVTLKFTAAACKDTIIVIYPT